MSIVGPCANGTDFTNKWFRFTLREVAHFYFAPNIVAQAVALTALGLAREMLVIATFEAPSKT